MNHYEIIVMINPDQNSEQVLKKICVYKKFITENNGLIHREEDWGRRQLAYPIKKLHKAYYILLNIELKSNFISLLKEKFVFDNTIIRHLILNIKNKVQQDSPMIKLKDENKK